MELSRLSVFFPPVTKDLIVYLPVLQLQNGFWLALKQADVALTDACQLYLINLLDS